MKIKALWSATKVAAKGTVELAKVHSPKLLLAAGLVAIGAGFAWAIVNTAKKLDGVCETHNNEIEKLKDLYDVDGNDEMTEGEKKEFRSEILKEKGHFILDVVRVYIGPVAIVGLGVASILTSHHILNTRYLGACTALQAVTEAYSQYREKVISEQGIEKDLEYASKSVSVDENGVIKTEKYNVPDDVNCITRIFSETTSESWTTIPDYNYAFIKGQLNAAKREGFQRGHLFLNDLLRKLNLPESEAGCYLGWAPKMGDEIVCEFDDISNLENFTGNVNKSNAWVLHFLGMRVLPPILEKEELLQPYKNAIAEYHRAMVNGGVLNDAE